MNQNLNTENKLTSMRWKGSILVPERREIYVKAEFLIDESTELAKNKEIIDRVEKELFNDSKKFVIESVDYTNNIFKRLEITKLYRNLIYVKFKPDKNENKSWVLIGNNKKAFAPDLGVYEEEYNEYRCKKKTYSIISIRPDLKYLIESFFIFPLKSKQNDQIDIGLKENLELSVVRDKDMLIGVIIPAFERNKPVPERSFLKLPIISSKECLQQVEVLKPEINNKSELIQDPRLEKTKRKIDLNLDDQRMYTNNLILELNENNSVKIDNEKFSNNADSIETIIKTEPKEIENEKNISLLPFDSKEMKIIENYMEIKTAASTQNENEETPNKHEIILNNSIDNLVIEVCSNEESVNEKTLEVDKKLDVKLAYWSGYLMTDKNQKFHSILSILNENSKYKEYLNSLLKDEKNIYIDKSPILEIGENDIFDYLTSLDRESIQFFKIESNECNFNEYYEDLLKRSKNLVKLRNSRNLLLNSHTIYLFAFNDSNQFDRLASDFNIKSIRMNEKCLIGVIIYSLSENTRKRKNSNDSNESNQTSMKNFKKSLSNVDEESLIIKKNQNYTRSVSIPGIRNNLKHKPYYFDSNSIKNNDNNSSHDLMPTFRRTFPFKKDFRSNYLTEKINTKILIFSGILTTDYKDEIKFIEDVLLSMECSNEKILKIEQIHNKYRQLRVTFENHIVGARILSRKKRYLKEHELFNRVFIDAEKIKS